METLFMSQGGRIICKEAFQIHTISLYRSRTGSYFYETEHEIWADFRPVGNTEIQIWGRFEGNFFMSSWTKKTFVKKNLYMLASALKR